jgi:hypothetical protein
MSSIDIQSFTSTFVVVHGLATTGSGAGCCISDGGTAFTGAVFGWKFAGVTSSVCTALTGCSIALASSLGSANFT